MATDNVVIGHFEYVDDTKNTIAALREKGFEDFELFSPMPNHDLEDEMYKGKKRSPVRMFTLLGALTGCTLGFLMTIWMSIDWPIRVSAKPFISIPAFVVVAFECTILIGAIVTFFSMFHFSRIPNIFSRPGFRPNFTEGTFGLVVRTEKDKADDASKVLKDGGANKVEVEYVR